MADSTESILQSSENRDELLQASLQLARSGDQSLLTKLSESLKSDGYLKRLDPKQWYRDGRNPSHLQMVLTQLRDNKSANAGKVIAGLIGDPLYMDNPGRLELLLRASSGIRPPDPSVLEFWDAHCQPADGYMNLTIRAAVDNGTPVALDFVEKRLNDSRFSLAEKKAWIISTFLVHRNDMPLLKMCERLLRELAPAELRPLVADVLFNYRPREWFSPATVLTPPPRSEAGMEVLNEMKSLAEFSLSSVLLSEDQALAVRNSVKEIDELIKKKQRR